MSLVPVAFRNILMRASHIYPLPYSPPLLLHTTQGHMFEQVHCGMVYLDHMEMMLPAFAGELLSCTAEIQFTSSYNLELRGAIWAEDLVNSM